MAIVNAMGQQFTVLSTTVSLQPEDLDTFAKVASHTVDDFLGQFPDSTRSVLSSELAQEIGNFLRDDFETASNNLAAAESVFSNMPPTDTIVQLGKDILGLTTHNVVQMLVHFGDKTQSAMGLVAKALGTQSSGPPNNPFNGIPNPIDVITKPF